MTYRGTMRNGVIVLEEGAKLPEGAEVSIFVNPADAERGTPPTSEELAAWERLKRTLLKYAGTIDELPADFAKNHDHYIHGAPKHAD